jgi:hypothetical protein
MLDDDRAVEDVFFGPGGAWSALPKSSIHVSLEYDQRSAFEKTG